jgi:virulence factor Mce-like protein
MIAFAVSCVGLLLFLWLSFGGTLPLAPQGYRLSAEFDQAVELGPQSDVRISGVSVGTVVSVGLDRHTGLTRAVMQFDSKYAPRPADTRAILRSKSLLGETYVELTPGSPTGPKLPDGATLPRAQVAPTVQLDQILSTFDPVTRRAFQIWMQQDAIALTGRGENFNAAFYDLFPFATNVDSVLAVLRRDSAATTTLLHDGGIVFSALSQSPSELQGFIRNSNAVFAATAARDTALANTVRELPGFLVATRAIVARTTRFAADATPLVNELLPAAPPLSSALQSIDVLAPDLRTVMVELAPLTHAAKTGVPALERFLGDSEPLLARLTPYLGGVVPVIDYINDYRREIAAFFANGTATTQARLSNIQQTSLLHYLRLSSPVNPEVLTAYSTRLESNRPNPYMEPGGYYRLLQGLPVFGGYLCTSNPQPGIGPTVPANLALVLRNVYYTPTPGGPPCLAQTPVGMTTTGQLQAFPHLQPLK